MPTFRQTALPQPLAAILCGLDLEDRVLQSFVADTSGRQHLRIPIPAVALGNEDIAEIRISVDRIFVPANLIAGSSDNRELGIRVNHAAIERDPVPTPQSHSGRGPQTAGS